MSKSVLPFLIFVVLIPALSATAVELGREQIATGFTSPVFMTAPPGDTTRLFVVEQGGVIKIITLSNNNVLGTPFLNISSDVDSSQGEQGLLGMAFHPDYNANGFFYVYYTHDPPGSGNDVSRIARYQANTPYATSNTANAGIVEVILLSFEQPQPNHNAGMLAFGPNDGYLYIASGDGGNFDDQGTGHDATLGNGQALDTFLGKILRIDVDEGGEGAGTGGASYDIPPTNPILGGGYNEIWAYGLRNPWRFGFDRDTGDLYIGDVGQGDWEEIDFQPAASSGGENYGWRIKEGPACFPPGSNCDSSGLTGPIIWYPNPEDGRSVIGGYPYRGAAIPFFEGHYIYGDFYGLARSFLVSGSSATLEQDWFTELQTVSITSFGEDANGELYFAIRSGSIYKIIPTDNAVVWVDFAVSASVIKKGSEAEPLNLLEVGVRSVADGGQINIVGSSTVTSSNEQFIIDRAMTIFAINGTVTIGAAARSARTSTEGFVSRP